MPVSKEEFDSVHDIGKRLKAVFQHDGIRGLDGMEDYLVNAVEHAKRLTKLAPDVCLTCDGKGEVNVVGNIVPCSDCVGTGKRR